MRNYSLRNNRRGVEDLALYALAGAAIFTVGTYIFYNLEALRDLIRYWREK